MFTVLMLCLLSVGIFDWFYQSRRVPLRAGAIFNSLLPVAGILAGVLHIRFVENLPLQIFWVIAALSFGLVVGQLIVGIASLAEYGNLRQGFALLYLGEPPPFDPRDATDERLKGDPSGGIVGRWRARRVAERAGRHPADDGPPH